MASANAQAVPAADSLVAAENITGAAVALKRRKNGDIFFMDAAGNRYTAPSGDRWAQKLFALLKTSE